MEYRGATVIIGQGLLRWGGSNAHFVDGLVGPALGVESRLMPWFAIRYRLYFLSSILMGTRWRSSVISMFFPSLRRPSAVSWTGSRTEVMVIFRSSLHRKNC